MEDPRKERTLVLVKPDGVFRGLVGQVISRFEIVGLRLVGMKMVWATKEQVRGHYPNTEEWLRIMGEKTHEAYKQYGIDVKKDMGTEDPVEIGKTIARWLEDYITMGPVVAMVWQGVHAISTVRKLVGNTLPVAAAPGTIRGDFSVDSNTAANLTKRPIRNIVHASGDQSEATHEIAHWFKEDELHSYRRVDEQLMFGDE